MLTLNKRSYTDCINLRAEGGYYDLNLGPVISTIQVGGIKTPRNIKISLSSSILREVWDETIIFIRI